MPSHAVPRRNALVPLLPLLSLAAALPLGAQTAVHGAVINALADSGRQRSPLYFGSAHTLAAGARGLSVHQAKNEERERGDHDVFRATSYSRDEFTSTVSAYWGVRDWLTLGGSLQLGTASNTFYRADGVVDPVTGYPRYFSSRGAYARGSIRAFGRARLYRSPGGATQLALNASAGAGSDMPSSVGVALAQRVGPVSLHLAPSFESRSEDGSFSQVAGAIVFPLLPRVTASLEGVAMGSRAGDWNRAATDPLFEIGGGLRFDLGRVKLDLGLRQSTGPASGPNSASRLRLVLGTHVKF